MNFCLLWGSKCHLWVHPSGPWNHDEHLWTRHVWISWSCWHWHIHWQCSIGNSLNIPHSIKSLSWYGARQCGKQSNAYNLILRLICGTCLHMTSDDDQTRPQHTSQPTWQTTSPWWWRRSSHLQPPAVWIWWTHAAWGVGGFAHVHSKATVKVI